MAGYPARSSLEELGGRGNLSIWKEVQQMQASVAVARLVTNVRNQTFFYVDCMGKARNARYLRAKSSRISCHPRSSLQAAISNPPSLEAPGSEHLVFYRGSNGMRVRRRFHGDAMEIRWSCDGKPRPPTTALRGLKSIDFLHVC